MKKELVAVVLAGGVGNRFWPLTTNKSLFPYFGKPLLEHSVSAALPQEITRIVIVTSPSNDEEVKKLIFSVPMTTVIQQTPDGMSGALLAAESQIAGASLFVINADDINDLGMYAGVLEHAKKSGAFGVIPGWKVEKYLPLGYLKFEGERIVEIKEKPGAGNEPSPYAYMVGYYLEDADMLLAQLKKTTSEKDDVHELALSALMKDQRLEVYRHTGGFASLKYPWHVLSVMDELFKRLKSHRGTNVVIKDNVIIEGEVYIEDDVKIFENTKITGPVYIGKGTIIGNGNIIRHSHIGANCVTGFATDITRSYIGDGCWFHSNYIGDSVLEKNISMGSGAVLANLRLDDGDISSMIKGQKISTGRNKLGAVIGAGVRIGVNASVMPGVKIGSDSYIGSGVVLDKDVPEKSFVVVKGGYQIVPNTSEPHDTDTRGEFKKHIS